MSSRSDHCDAMPMVRHGHIIREETSGETFSCGEGETVLQAVVRCGSKIIPVGCRNGGCGLCKIHILEGDYCTGKMSRAHVSELDERAGYALACRTTPVTSLKVRACRQVDATGMPLQEK